MQLNSEGVFGSAIELTSTTCKSAIFRTFIYTLFPNPSSRCFSCVSITNLTQILYTCYKPIKIAPVMLKEQNFDRMFFLSSRCLGKNRDMAKSIEYLMWLQQGHRIRGSAFTGQFNINASSNQFQQPVLLGVQLHLISFITLGLGCYKGVTHIRCPRWGGRCQKSSIYADF